MEGKVVDVRVMCNESLTPDVELTECATLWAPLGKKLSSRRGGAETATTGESSAAAQLAAPFWFTRNATGYVNVAAAMLGAPTTIPTGGREGEVGEEQGTPHDVRLSHEIRSSIIEELSVPTLCRVGPDDVIEATLPVRHSLIDWSSRNVEVETARTTRRKDNATSELGSAAGDDNSIVVVDRTWHHDALGHALHNRHTAQLRRKELRRIVITNPDGDKQVRNECRVWRGGWVKGGNGGVGNSNSSGFWQ